MDVVISSESAAAFDELTRSNQDDLIRRQDKNFWPNSFRGSRFIPAVEYINANRHRSTLIEELNAFTRQYDVIIVPTFSGNQLAMTNLTGHPVVVFPVGFNQNGLPTSITLLGNLYDEATILAVAKAYQDATSFHTVHPEKFKQVITAPKTPCRTIFFILFLSVLMACNSKKQADLIVYNATMYTVDSAFSTAEAVAVKDGKIIATGKSADLLAQYDAKEKRDAQGKFIYPGLIDAHAHFFRYGTGLQSANLVGTTSWEEVIKKVEAFAAENPQGWITGRGWDQNDWPVKEFPINEKLNQLFPDRPVLLGRIDGHGAIANQRALGLAGIQPGTTLTGGTVEVKQGKLTGILIDNAIDLVRRKVPSPTTAQIKKGVLQAQANCFALGLTTVDDCGLHHEEITFMDSLQRSGDLKMRVYAMLSDAPANYDFMFAKGKMERTD